MEQPAILGHEQDLRVDDLLRTRSLKIVAERL